MYYIQGLRFNKVNILWAGLRGGVLFREYLGRVPCLAKLCLFVESTYTSNISSQKNLSSSSTSLVPIPFYFLSVDKYLSLPATLNIFSIGSGYSATVGTKGSTTCFCLAYTVYILILCPLFIV